MILWPRSALVDRIQKIETWEDRVLSWIHRCLDRPSTAPSTKRTFPFSVRSHSYERNLFTLFLFPKLMSKSNTALFLERDENQHGRRWFDVAKFPKTSWRTSRQNLLQHPAGQLRKNQTRQPKIQTSFLHSILVEKGLYFFHTWVYVAECKIVKKVNRSFFTIHRSTSFFHTRRSSCCC